MNRLGVFALTVTGGLLAMGGASYIKHQKSGGKAKGHRGAHEARHHRKLKKMLPEALTNPVALMGVAGAATMTAILWTPCACLPGQTAVPGNTPDALPPATGPAAIPSTTQSDFGPITR